MAWTLPVVRVKGWVAAVAVLSLTTGASHWTGLRASAAGRFEETGATPWKERVQCEHCSGVVFRDQGWYRRCLAGRMVEADDAGFVAASGSQPAAWQSVDLSVALAGAAMVDLQVQPDDLQWRERTQCMHWGVDVFHDHCRWRWRRAERAASASLLRAGPPQPPPPLRLMPSLVPHQPVPRWAEGCCLLMAAARHALRPI